MRPFPSDFRLFLASQSPRRRELLGAAAIPFVVVPSGGQESEEGPDPVAVAHANALAKARGALLGSDAGGSFVLGADTVVAVGRCILGKPADREGAAAMMRELQGREHSVTTAVALRLLGDGHDAAESVGHEAAESVGHATTSVRFGPLTQPDIEAYLDSGEWRDKAGAYGIQGLAALFVEEIRGDYANVVGLPLYLLGQLFHRLGFDLLRRDWMTGREQV